jgi:hypothetical protein
LPSAKMYSISSVEEQLGEPWGAADVARTAMGLVNDAEAIAQPLRDGMMFVLSPAAVLPARCIKCNAECRGLRITRRISTFSPWYPLFSSAGWNAHCVDDRPIDITYSLCTRHRFQALGRAAIIGFFGLANIFCWLSYEHVSHLRPILDALTIGMPILLLATVLTFRPILRPRRVHHGQAWFAGAGEEFLESLPRLENEPVRQAA